MCGVGLICDKIRNSVIHEEYEIENDIATRIQKVMLRWFEHLERMNGNRSW